MISDPQLAAAFDPIRSANENIYWAGRPHYIPYLITGVPFLLFGLAWGAMDYFGFIRNMPRSMDGFAIPFFALHLFPFWGSILYLLSLLISYRNVAYAVTDQRLIIRSGVFGINYKTVDLDKIASMEVSVGPIEAMVGAGSILANAGRTTSRGAVIFDRFTAVDEPYEVFKQIKELSNKGKSAGSGS